MRIKNRMNWRAKNMVYLSLFWSFFQIGLFSFGGGYASMPLIRQQVVSRHQWLSLDEFTDLITISQMTPGPIAINCATFVGNRIAGIPGAVMATIGSILPSCLIVLLLAFLYNKYKNIFLVKGILQGIKPAIIAMIGVAGITIAIQSFLKKGVFTGEISDIDFVSIGIFAVSLFVLRKWKTDQIKIMIAAGGVGLVIFPFLN